MSAIRSTKSFPGAHLVGAGSRSANRSLSTRTRFKDQRKLEHIRPDIDCTAVFLQCCPPISSPDRILSSPSSSCRKRLRRGLPAGRARLSSRPTGYSVTSRSSRAGTRYTAFCPRFLKTGNCEIRTRPPMVRRTVAHRSCDQMMPTFC